jgi:hypothetical protein
MQAVGGRGCGTRSEGGCYLCLGIGSGGSLTVENLIIDPIKIWPGQWQRGFKILPNKQGFNDVGIFVGEEFYPSLWDFVEEARRFGISRKVPPTFPFEQLTPGKSRMVFIHRKAYPKFDYMDADLGTGKISAPLSGCKMLWEPEIWKRAFPGWHPRIEKEGTFCTFSHQHFAGLIHNAAYDDKGQFEIKMLSFSYSGFMPVVRNDDAGNRIKLEWQIGAFMVAPLSHLEMPKKLNKSAAQRANKAGYEVIVTDW